MKDKKKLIIIAVLITISIALLIFTTRGRGREVSPTPTPTIALPAVDESVEVSLTPRADKKAVVLKIDHIPSKTTSIDYELSYKTGEGLPRGVLGSINLKKGEESVEREIVLGTCSRNVCVYDKDVEKLNLVLKFNSPEGSSQFQKEYQL